MNFRYKLPLKSKKMNETIVEYYSETTSTRATQGLSANQKQILKQRIEHVDHMGNCLIF